MWTAPEGAADISRTPQGNGRHTVITGALTDSLWEAVGRNLLLDRNPKTTRTGVFIAE